MRNILSIVADCVIVLVAIVWVVVRLQHAL